MAKVVNVELLLAYEDWLMKIILVGNEHALKNPKDA